MKFVVAIVMVLGVGCAEFEPATEIESSMSKNDSGVTALPLSDIPKATEALYALIDVISDVYGKEPTAGNLADMREITIIVESADSFYEFNPGRSGSAWTDEHGRRGIRIPDDLDTDLTCVLTHEALHHLADLMALPGDNWKHESPKTWRCSESVEAIATRLQGGKFWNGLGEAGCAIVKQ